jgi:hypothetical protein
MELAWGVLDKYYSKTDEVVYYAAALILHPARHTEYIKNNWPRKWSGPTLTKIKQLWAAYRDDISLSSEEDHEQPPIQKLNRVGRNSTIFEDNSASTQGER